MRNYSVPKNRKRGDRGRIIVENPLMSFLLCLAVFAIGIALAGLIALKLYLVSLPPIKNLNTLKPNIVTTFCAADGEVINLSNPDYPIWATVAKSRRGRQTMSVSIIDSAGSQLDFTGNDGTIEADTITWLDLLTGLGTGQAIDILHGLKVRHNTDSIQLITPEGVNLYLAPQAPDGEIPEGSFGLGW